MHIAFRAVENFRDNSSQPLLNVCISFAIVETFFIIAFIFSWHYNSHRSTNTKTMFVLILGGYIFAFGGVVMGILMITLGGAGYHVQSVDPDRLRTLLQLIKAHEMIYTVSIALPKLAILCLYWRLFTSKLSRFVLCLTGVIVIATCLFGLIMAFVNCRPFASFWDVRIHGHCTIDIMTVFRYYSIPNIATDAMMIVLPIPFLWKLQLGVFTKLDIFLTFLISSAGIVTAILRFISFIQTDVFKDISYLCVTTTSWTVIEAGTYLIAATIPTLRPLLRHMTRALNESCPVTQAASNCFRSTDHTCATDDPDHEHRVLKKKPSEREMLHTIGRRPSRTLQLDTYHNIVHESHGRSPISARSPISPKGVKSVKSARTLRELRDVDEESMVCADAVIHEVMGRQGRNPDGSLRDWSLGPPVRMSPMRTSFLHSSSSGRGSPV